MGFVRSNEFFRSHTYKTTAEHHLLNACRKSFKGSCTAGALAGTLRLKRRVDVEARTAHGGLKMSRRRVECDECAADMAKRIAGEAPRLRRRPRSRPAPNDLATGEVVITPKPTSWQDFFGLADRTDIPADFMIDREDPPAEKRNLF